MGAARDAGRRLRRLVEVRGRARCRSRWRCRPTRAASAGRAVRGAARRALRRPRLRRRAPPRAARWPQWSSAQSPSAALPAMLVRRHARPRSAQLAAHWRRRFAARRWSRVAGSNGKTTAKEMLRRILRRRAGGRTARPRATSTTSIGLPLTVLGLRAGHRHAPCRDRHEPARGRSHTSPTLRRPGSALVNNAQREHLEFMGSVEEVADEKGAVYGRCPTTASRWSMPTTPTRGLQARRATRRRARLRPRRGRRGPRGCATARTLGSGTACARRPATCDVPLATARRAQRAQRARGGRPALARRRSPARLPRA